MVRYQWGKPPPKKKKKRLSKAQKTAILLKKQREREKEVTKDWLQQTLLNIDSEKLLSYHQKHSSLISRKLAKLLIKADATIDGALKLNTFLAQEYGESSALGVDVEDFKKAVEEDLRVEIFKMLLQNTELSLKTQRRIFDRQIARTLPKSDNVANTLQNDDKRVLKPKNSQERAAPRMARNTRNTTQIPNFEDNPRNFNP